MMEKKAFSGMVRLGDQTSEMVDSENMFKHVKSLPELMKRPKTDEKPQPSRTLGGWYGR